MFVTAIGLLAAFLTTISFVPQVVRIWTTRSARDISLLTFTVYTIGIALWLVYGILRDDIAVILSNIFTVVLAATVLALKIRFG